jgi:hypothetical protein
MKAATPGLGTRIGRAEPNGRIQRRLLFPYRSLGSGSICTLQDTASHATYCGDDAPSPPGGGDVGTYTAIAAEGVRLQFGASRAAGPHIAGHLEETGTGDKPLPVRDYTALNATLKELVVFGNVVAKPQGWIVNPELLPTSLSSVFRMVRSGSADCRINLPCLQPVYVNERTRHRARQIAIRSTSCARASAPFWLACLMPSPRSSRS